MDDKELLKMEDGYTAYLQMIQEIINRMSTNSALFKGFTASLVAGIVAILFSGLSFWAAILATLSIICFGGLDIYYLQLEKRYRFLYEQVRTGKHQIDFSMDPPSICEANLTIMNCILSKSIIGFYLPILVVLLSVVLGFQLFG